jgi:hypothetical protein
VDRTPDALVCTTATPVTHHRRIDIGIRRMGVLGKKGSPSHDLPGLTVAALDHVLCQPCFLQRVCAVWRQAFDRRDLMTHCLGNWEYARALWIAINVDRAGATDTLTATVLGAHESESIA